MSVLYQSLRDSYYAVRKLPVLRGFFQRRYDKIFFSSRNANLFRGVFKTMAEAQASAIDQDRVGYDRKEPAEMYRDRLAQIYNTDYPVLFWLKNLLTNNYFVFDLGGHIGVSFYAYSQVIEWPENLRWQVCDVPAVVDIGSQLAIEEKTTGLSFTTEIADMEAADLLLASGSLQYIETNLATMLSSLRQPPSELIINLLPLHSELEFVTLQNIGTAFCPYRIFNFESFEESLTDIGYKLEAKWENPEKACAIPFHEQYSIDKYHGYYFSATDKEKPTDRIKV